MNRRTFITMAVGMSVVTGLLDLLVPVQICAVFGVTLDDTGASLARLLGAAYLGYAATIWLARDVHDANAQRAIGSGNVVSWGLSLIVVMVGVASGLAGTLAWSLAATAVVFSAGWGYFTFVDRADSAVTNPAST